MRIIPSRGVCGHTDTHIFRLTSALRVLMNRRVSGRVAQPIAGHVSFGAVASRGALSLLNSVYLFAAQHWMLRGIPWDSLKCELSSTRFSLSLSQGDRTNCWGPEVCCSGAFFYGWSFASRTAIVSLVARHGRVWNALASAATFGACRHGDGRLSFLRRNLRRSRERDFLGKCVARSSSFDHRQCQEP